MITLYVNNKLDGARQAEPSELATKFIAAVRADYFKTPCGGGSEWAFRLWLTAADGASSSWNTTDTGAFMSALTVATEDGEVREMLARAIWGDEA